ncbi:uncharacterized protein LOC126234544 isoform X1 [Schistocerca nitens]|uniref:uncharacterized protein LOC126234544 isoform X1 n=2 Tax=Schistocerca nitens TaxID=7011 RepID=UPI00211838FE|nr:uncharacterized protein LOC126234544 isoform X1 [Schistocerca nitens]
MNNAHRFALWALSVAATAILADIANSGPYFIDMEAFEPCDDIGTLGINFEVRLIVDSDNNTVYEGDLTFPYDLSDPEMTTSVLIDRWGSTGGWSRIYNLTEKDMFTYMKLNFPNIFEAYYGSFGVTGPPAPAGKYNIKHFFPLNLKLQRMASLIYGRFKLNYLQFKDGEALGCLQSIFRVNEEAVDAAGDAAKRHFG